MHFIKIIYDLSDKFVIKFPLLQMSLILFLANTACYRL